MHIVIGALLGIIILWVIFKISPGCGGFIVLVILGFILWRMGAFGVIFNLLRLLWYMFTDWVRGLLGMEQMMS